MNTDSNKQPPDPAGEMATPEPASEKDVIIFRGPDGEALLVLPADKVAAIIPDRYLSRQSKAGARGSSRQSNFAKFAEIRSEKP